MRYLLIVLLFISSFAQSFAQQLNKGKLTFSTSGNNKLLVVIGDKMYWVENKELTFRQLEPGTYAVKVYRLIRNDLPTNNWNNYKKVSDMNLYVKAGYHHELSINRFGNSMFYEMQITNYNNTDEWNSDWLVNNDPWLSTDQSNMPGGYGGGTGNNNNTGGYNTVMSDEAFAEFKRLMKNESFDSKMVDFFRANSKKNLFNTQQIKELCLLISFDRYKLDLAKIAYDYTVDKGNYFILYSVFSFDSYKRSLQEYVNSR